MFDSSDINQNISNWNMGSITNINGMISSSRFLNGIDDTNSTDSLSISNAILDSISTTFGNTIKAENFTDTDINQKLFNAFRFGKLMFVYGNGFQDIDNPENFYIKFLKKLYPNFDSSDIDPESN